MTTRRGTAGSWPALAATGFLAREGIGWPPGVHSLPARVADRADRLVLST